ncbi:MAG: hypothetical protein AAF465_07220 [Pseudomonadota bacterium]
MAAHKPLIGKAPRGIPAKSGAVNFFFQQDSGHLKRQWQKRSDDFWSATRPSVSNQAPSWREFENWQSGKKAKS